MYSSTRRQGPPTRGYGQRPGDMTQKPGNSSIGGKNDPREPGGARNGGNSEDMDLETTFKRVKVVSAVNCTAGLIGIVTGILALIYAWPNPVFPAISCVPIWAGSIVVGSASCGIHASRQEISVFNETVKKLVIAQFWVACFSLATTGLMLGWSCWISWDCGKEVPADWCQPNAKELYGISSFSVVVALFMFLSTVPIVSMYCYLKNTFYNKVGT